MASMSRRGWRGWPIQAGSASGRVVRDQVLDKLSFRFEELAAQALKNIARPVQAYRVNWEAGAPDASSSKALAAP